MLILIKKTTRILLKNITISKKKFYTSLNFKIK